MPSPAGRGSATTGTAPPASPPPPHPRARRAQAGAPGRRVVTSQPPSPDLPLSRFLELLAGPDPAPSGGGAAALAVCLGAGLCAMAARLSAGQLGADEAADLTTNAERTVATAASLIQADADSYRGVITAQRQPADTAGAYRRRPDRAGQAA